MLSVGVELRSWVTTPRAGSMLAIIDEVRGVYPGLLTYSANLDDVEDTLHSLRKKGAAILVEGGGRVARWKHTLYDWLKVSKVKLAVLAELLHRQACDGMLGIPQREHLDTARRAVEIAEQVGAASLQLHAQLTLGMLHCAFGELEEGAALLDRIGLIGNGAHERSLDQRPGFLPAAEAPRRQLQPPGPRHRGGARRLAGRP